MVDKSVGTALVSAVRRDITFYALSFKKGIVLTAAIACVGKQIAP